MEVWQVVFERCEDKEMIDVVEYVEAKQLLDVAVQMSKRAKEMGWELKLIRYMLTVVEKIESFV